MAIIQDADNDQNRSFQQIQKTLIKIGFNVSPAFGRPFLSFSCL